jgi:hypothetical protein
MQIFVITVICLVLAAPASAGLYKWKDENGKTHFTDDPSRIPLDNRNKKDMKKMQSSTSKGVKNNLPSAAPAPARKHLGAKKEGSNSKGTGVDKQRVKDLLRLNQKRHYTH